MPKRRITLSIDEDLVSRFQAAADLERRSLSSMVESWLEQVVSPAEWIASLAESQRGTGQRNIQAVIAALQVAQEQTVETIVRARKGGRSAGSAHPAALTPPSCNTGGKLPKSKQSKGRRDEH